MDSPRSIDESLVTAPLSQQQDEGSDEDEDDNNDDASFVADKIRSLFGLHASERLLGGNYPVPSIRSRDTLFISRHVNTTTDVSCYLISRVPLLPRQISHLAR